LAAGQAVITKQAHPAVQVAVVVLMAMRAAQGQAGKALRVALEQITGVPIVRAAVVALLLSVQTHLQELLA
jgi:hypothetical protein